MMDKLGVRYLVVRERNETTHKWADVSDEADALRIANEGNTRKDGWTYRYYRSGV